MSAEQHFLVIGAQKCGTTTIYEDLRTHPDVALSEKESAGLLVHDVATPEGRAAYWRMFPARAAGLTGEVATDYAMLPEIDAVAKAAAVFDRVKVVYIVRDPVKRVISHHHHMVTERRAPESIVEALAGIPALVDNSRYATQIRPWIEAFGRDAVLVLRFEDYMADRRAGFAQLQEFLGLPVRELPNPEQAHNVATEKRVAVGGWRRVRQWRLYRSVVRRLLPPAARRRLMQAVLPPPPARPAGPPEETLGALVADLQPEVDALATLLGTAPWWNLEAHLSGSPS